MPNLYIFGTKKCKFNVQNNIAVPRVRDIIKVKNQTSRYRKMTVTKKYAAEYVKCSKILVFYKKKCILDPKMQITVK